MSRPKFLMPMGVILILLCAACATQGDMPATASKPNGIAGTRPLETYPTEKDLSRWCPQPNATFTEASTRDVLRGFLYDRFGSGSCPNAVCGDVHIDSYVRLPVVELINAPHSVAVVRIGPSGPTPSPDSLDERLLIRFLGLYREDGAKQWEMRVDDNVAYSRSAFALSVVASRFQSAPFVLFCSNTGGDTRSYSYTLYRPTAYQLESVWQYDEDGYSHSTSAAYTISTVDFSGLLTGDANEIVVLTTKAARRLADASMTEKDLIPVHRRTVYKYDPQFGRFVKK